MPRCYAALDNPEAALADLDVAAQGSPDMDLVDAARAFVYQKQGQAEKAEEAFKQAREFIPRVQPIGDPTQLDPAVQVRLFGR